MVSRSLRLARKPAQHGAFADRAVRLSTLKDHEKIYRLIAKGDVAGAERAGRDHYSDAAQETEGWQHAFDLNATIDASSLRDA